MNLLVPSPPQFLTMSIYQPNSIQESNESCVWNQEDGGKIVLDYRHTMSSPVHNNEANFSSVPACKDDEAATPPKLGRKRSKGKLKEKVIKMGFVERVYTMLEDAKAESFEDIVGWEPDGKSFKVHKTTEFEETIQPMYLNQSKLRSFQRKLIAHGFTRIQGGPSRGAYRHSKFLKGNRDLCLEIERDEEDVPIVGSASSSALGSDDDASAATSNNNVSSSTAVNFSQYDVAPDPEMVLAPALSPHFMKAAEESRPVISRRESTQERETERHLHPAYAMLGYIDRQILLQNDYSMDCQKQEDVVAVPPSSSSWPSRTATAIGQSRSSSNDRGIPFASHSVDRMHWSYPNPPDTDKGQQQVVDSSGGGDDPWQPLALLNYYDGAKHDDEPRLTYSPYKEDFEMEGGFSFLEGDADTLSTPPYPTSASRRRSLSCPNNNSVVLEPLTVSIFDLEMDLLDNPNSNSAEASESSAIVTARPPNNNTRDYNNSSPPSSLENIIEEFMSSSLSPSSDPFSPRPILGQEEHDNK